MADEKAMAEREQGAAWLLVGGRPESHAVGQVLEPAGGIEDVLGHGERDPKRHVLAGPVLGTGGDLCLSFVVRFVVSGGVGSHRSTSRGDRPGVENLPTLAFFPGPDRPPGPGPPGSYLERTVAVYGSGA
jgi:hypothetical protein